MSTQKIKTIASTCVDTRYSGGIHQINNSIYEPKKDKNMENEQYRSHSVSFRVTARIKAELTDEAKKVGMSLSEFCCSTMDMKKKAITDVNEPSKKEIKLEAEIAELKEQILELSQKICVKEELHGIELLANSNLRTKDVQWGIHYKNVVLERDGLKKELDDVTTKYHKTLNNIDAYADRNESWSPITLFVSNSMRALKA